MRVTIALVTAAASCAFVLQAAPAVAADTPSATLHCGDANYTVTGFGRGSALHVVGSSSNFVITRIVASDGTVQFNHPVGSGVPQVICTTVSPSGNAYTLTGFFTPVG
jgi:hypothetical protein